MASAETPIYRRVRISGRLTNGNALHVGDGGVLSLSERDCPKTGEDEENPTYNSVCIDADGKPYLPASTLRGFLRNVVYRIDGDLEKRLFGFAEENRGQAGAVRVHDACLVSLPSHKPSPGYWDQRRSTTLRHGIAINPIAGTVAEHKLFSYEYVPAESVFSLLIEADRLQHSDLPRLLGLLSAWDESASSTIGKGITKLQGRMKWCLDKVEVLNEQSLQGWLASDEPLDRFFEVLKFPPAPEPPAPLALQVLHFHILPDSPFLVNDPGYVPKKTNKEDRDPNEEQLPDLEYRRLPNGWPMIPAANLRGMLRGRARRILATLMVQRGVPHEKAGKGSR